jgi:tetratricopeptide (TPR) repeat protein
LARLLGTLGVVRATGVLDITRAKLVRRFVLRDGRLQALVSNGREDRFFDWLITRGDLAALSPEKLVAAHQALAQRTLTAAFVLAEEMVSKDGVAPLLRDHLFDLLLDSARAGDAHFAIHPGRTDLGDEPTADWPAVAAALKLARDETASARKSSPLPEAVAAVASIEDLSEAGLEPLEEEVMAACSSAVEVAALVDRLRGRDAGEVQAVLGALLRAGLLAPAAPAEEEFRSVTEDALERWLAAAGAEDFPGLLGVSPKADPATVRRAYYRTVRKFHPDRFREGPLAGRHAEVEAAFRLVNEALSLLTDPQARADREARLRRQQTTAAPRDPREVAREYSEKALSALRQGRRIEAITMLGRAAQVAPDEPLYSLHLGLLLLGNPARRGEAATRLLSLADAHPDRADVLGACALALAKTGRPTESAAMRKRALALDPRQITARLAGGEATAVKDAKSNPFLAPLV